MIRPDQPDDRLSFLRPLLEQGLISPWRTAEELFGNLDRAPAERREHWLLELIDRQRVKVTRGPGLDHVHERARAWHQAMPALAPSPARILPLADGSWVTIEPAFEQRTIEELLRHEQTLPTALRGLRQALQALQAVEVTSAPAAWDAEWSDWSHQVERLTCWTAPERHAIARHLLPVLKSQLRPEPLRRRWSNGDFTSANLRASTSASPRLTDPEFASETHFYPEDFVRFRELSAAVREHPGLLAAWWPQLPPAWTTFFHLRQLLLDETVNSASYRARTAAERKAAVARSAAAAGLPILGLDSALAPASEPEETVQLFWSSNGQWHEAASARAGILRGREQFVAFRLPAGQTRLRLDPAAGRRTIVLHHVAVAAPDGAVTDLRTRLTSPNCRLHAEAAITQIEPTDADPQLLLEPVVHGDWLVLKLTVEE